MNAWTIIPEKIEVYNRLWFCSDFIVHISIFLAYQKCSAPRFWIDLKPRCIEHKDGTDAWPDPRNFKKLYPPGIPSGFGQWSTKRIRIGWWILKVQQVSCDSFSTKNGTWGQDPTFITTVVPCLLQSIKTSDCNSLRPSLTCHCSAKPGQQRSERGRFFNTRRWTDMAVANTLDLGNCK